MALFGVGRRNARVKEPVPGPDVVLPRRDLDGWILAAFIVGKLSYEQIAGQMPFAGGANTIVDAHLYGAIGGLLGALVLVFVLKRRPQSL